MREWFRECREGNVGNFQSIRNGIPRSRLPSGVRPKSDLRVKENPPILNHVITSHHHEGPEVYPRPRPRFALLLPLAFLLTACGGSRPPSSDCPDTSGFSDGSHHWYDIRDEEQVITPLPEQRRYPPDSVAPIADNILLYQKPNGGWPKNYDMRAVLTDAQKARVQAARDDLTTTFDNGATHSQVSYLARAYQRTGDVRYSAACRRGIEFILSAQYPGGGWPQYFPDTSGYRKYITFNDGAMVGVLGVLRDIAQNAPEFLFVDSLLRSRAREALRRGVECILRSQVLQDDSLTGWCQQHDQVTLAPRWARSFEPAALASMESAAVLLFLLSLHNSSPAIEKAVHAAGRWLDRVALHGIRVKTIKAQPATYQYHQTASDRVVVQDPDAPRIWSRYYELQTGRPLFCNRDGKPVYSLAEVDRERRTGYAWYTYEPEKALVTLSSHNHNQKRP